jgi:putative inorganic carbon (HCO3(-)) transporter
MQSQIKFKNQNDIKGYYSLHFKTLWSGFKQEHASFWFLCIYFLFEYVRPQVLYPALDILPWSFIFLILSVFAAFLDKSVTWVTSPINKLFVFFILIIISSAIFSDYPEVSWAGRNTMLTWVLAYFLVICVVNTERRLLLFLLAYLLLSLKMSQSGVRDWVSRGFSFAGYGLIGSPGWFRNSGEYAIQMLIFGSLALAYVVSFREFWGKYKKWIMFAAASTGYLAVMGASSRGAQLGLAIIMIWGVLKIRGGFKFLILIIALGIALYHLLPEHELERFRSAGTDSTSLQRLAYWRVGIKLAEEHPVLGIGYLNWTPVTNKLYPEGVGPFHQMQVPHSIYIQLAAEMGYTGLICYIFMVLAAFFVNEKTRRLIKNSQANYIAILSYGLDAGLIGFLVAGAFVTVTYYPFFWIQIAMIVMLNNVATRLVKEANSAGST